MSLPRIARNVLDGLLRKHGQTAVSPTDKYLKVLGEIWSEKQALMVYVATGDIATAVRLRQRFGLAGTDCDTFYFPPDLLRNDGLDPVPCPKTTIIVPVFNSYDDLVRLCQQLEQTSQDMSMIFVDDASTDKRVGPLLETFTAQPNRHLISNRTNRGFVHSVNAALDLATDCSDGHVILLNTDTLPPPGWIPRLLAPILADPDVASVTPLSNNAEILTVPEPGLVTDPDAQMIDALDHAAQTISPSCATVELPTGIGFCMAINSRFLDVVGPLDSAFGRGYGEEVDWCQRASAIGGHHLAALNLVVGHRGGASFGQAEKAARIRTASQIISDRYPDYDQAVSKWIEDAPAAPQKLVVSLAWLAHASTHPVPIYLAHSLGGGAETALMQEIADCLDANTPGVVVLRVGGPRPWQLELHTALNTQKGAIDDLDLVMRLLAPVTRRRVIYSCGVGAADPASVPCALLDLAADRGTVLDLRIHDFFPISPAWNLLESDGQFHGVPQADSRDPAHRLQAAKGQPGLSHEEWRHLCSRVIRRSDEVTVFAPSGRDLMTRAYPDSAPKIRLRPHAMPNLPPRLSPGGRTIGVLGGINLPKGAGVLMNLARHRNRTDRHRIVVVGEMDGAFRLKAPNVVHGRYDPSQIGVLARKYDIGLWLVPSICPETFSFATHEALATGLPVLCFDLGAQADAIRQAENGRVITAPPQSTDAIWNDIKDAFAEAQSPMSREVS